MKKSFVAIILILVVAVTSTQAFAAYQDEAPLQPAMDNATSRLVLIRDVAPYLSVSGASATYSLSVTCATSVNKLSAKLQIQQLVNGTWKDYGSSWSASSSTYRLSTSGSKAIATGYSYRLKVVITASNGTETGTLTAYS